MSADSFLDSTIFSLAKNNFNNKIKFGYNNEEVKLAEGVGRETISGVLPLFLFKEHWKVAKRKFNQF